jgi:hypothetical protein
MTKRPQNGPTFSKAPPKNHRSTAIASPERRQAELDEKKSDAAKSRRFDKLMRTDSHGWLREIGLVSGEPKPPDPLIKRRRV